MVEDSAPTAVIGYIAGFFDGEGCLSWSKQRNGSQTVRVEVAQNEVAPLELIQKYFGGTIILHSNGKCHKLRFNGFAAIPFVEAIEPLLLVKGDKAREVLAYYAEKRSEGKLRVMPSV